MSDPSREFLVVFLDQFKAKVRAKEASISSQYKVILDNPSSLSIEQLQLCYNAIAGDPDLYDYIMTLIVIKLASDSPLSDGKGLDHYT